MRYNHICHYNRRLRTMSGPEGSSIKWNLARVAGHRLEPGGFFYCARVRPIWQIMTRRPVRHMCRRTPVRFLARAAASQSARIRHKSARFRMPESITKHLPTSPHIFGETMSKT